MNRKHQKTLRAVFSIPTAASINFSDIEKLLVALGAEKIEGSGSRVAFVMRAEKSGNIIARIRRRKPESIKSNRFVNS